MSEARTGEFSGRVALVTGGGRGIGRAVCTALAAWGAGVAFSYRRAEDEAVRTVAAAEAHGVRALAVRANMGVADEVTGLVERARRDLGPITLLVNSAAYTRLLEPDDLTPERWRLFMTTNADAPYLTTWAVVPDMRAAGGGAIVNISSLSSMSPTPAMVGYAASKGALNSFGRACAQAFAGDNIRVNTVLPGLVLTPRADTVDAEILRRFAADIPLGRGGTPEEIAETVVFLLSGRASYITGEEILVAGGRR